jgi:hypothetical protein
VPNPPRFRSYACGIRGMAFDEGVTIINATSRGRAKAIYWSQVRDCYPDVRFTEVTAKVNGGPITPERLQRCAEYRKLDVRGGSIVQCGDSRGYVVDGNSSANFNVEFFEGKHKGLILNCHPSELEVVRV